MTFFPKDNIKVAVKPSSSRRLHCRRDSITASGFADLFLCRDWYTVTVINNFRELSAFLFLRITVNHDNHKYHRANTSYQNDLINLIRQCGQHPQPITLLFSHRTIRCSLAKIQMENSVKLRVKSKW